MPSIDTQAKVWIMRHKFDGAAKHEDFAVEEKTIPGLEEGEILSEAECWSTDPFNKVYTERMGAGTPMVGLQVAKVIESRHENYPVGELIVGFYGWRTHTVDNPDKPKFGVPPTKVGSYLEGFPSSYAIGMLGMPGLSAYFGLLHCCEPKRGETVVVNAAAGAVGHIVGQIAKIKGCNVVGYAGSEDKVEWLKSLGFDHVYNYKTCNMADSIKEGAPNGVDCLFDNVGGTSIIPVYMAMNSKARVCQCGAISQYNNISNPNMMPDVLSGLIVGKEITIKGFLVRSYYQWAEHALAEMAHWAREGKLQTKEFFYDGFESMPQALMDQIAGKNPGGKVIVRNHGRGGGISGPVITGEPVSDDHVIAQIKGTVKNVKKMFEN